MGRHAGKPIVVWAPDGPGDARLAVFRRQVARWLEDRPGVLDGWPSYFNPRDERDILARVAALEAVGDFEMESRDDQIAVCRAVHEELARIRADKRKRYKAAVAKAEGWL